MTTQMNEHQFTITRILDAPRDLVWAAWTEPEQFAAWFGPEHFTTPVESVEIDADIERAVDTLAAPIVAGAVEIFENAILVVEHALRLSNSAVDVRYGEARRKHGENQRP